MMMIRYGGFFVFWTLSLPKGAPDRTWTLRLSKCQVVGMDHFSFDRLNLR